MTRRGTGPDYPTGVATVSLCIVWRVFLEEVAHDFLSAFVEISECREEVFENIIAEYNYRAAIVSRLMGKGASMLCNESNSERNCFRTRHV